MCSAAAAKSLQSCLTLQPPRRQPIRLRRPWNSPGKNTGVGCHVLFQCIKVKSESEVAELCPTFCDPMDCIPPGSSVHGIFQARVLEWVAIAFSDYVLSTYWNVNHNRHNRLSFLLNNLYNLLISSSLNIWKRRALWILRFIQSYLESSRYGTRIQAGQAVYPLQSQLPDAYWLVLCMWIAWQMPMFLKKK